MATPIQGTSTSRPGTSNKVHFCDCVFGMPAHMCSTNGTHIDGEEIHVPTPVGDGSEISLGGESMSLRAVDCNAIIIVDRPFKHDAALG